MGTAAISFQQLKEEAKKLTPSEKLELNEMLWNDDIAIPLEHQHLVNERIKSAAENPEEMLDWEDAIKMLHS